MERKKTVGARLPKRKWTAADSERLRGIALKKIAARWLRETPPRSLSMAVGCRNENVITNRDREMHQVCSVNFWYYNCLWE